MAQMLDPDAIFATAEPTRRSGRAPQPRQNFAQDAYRAEREEEKKRKAALAKKPRGPSRPAPPRSKWENYERRVDGQIAKARSAAFFIETYAMDANRGSKRVQPKQELAKAKATLKAARSEIRNVLEEVAGLHSEIRWGTEKELTEEDRNADLVPDEAKIREEDQNLPGINVEEVACSICGQYESTDDNDIIMCDRTNCFRAFHVKCCEPVMTAEMLGGPDEDWFCHQCSTIDNIVEKVNEYFDKNYTCAGWKDVFAKEEEEVRVPTGGILDMDFGSGDDEDDEDHDEEDVSDDEEDDASDVVSRCSGDVALGVKVPEDKIDVRNILEGPRKKQKLDYAALNAALSDAESDDGGAFYASLPKPRPPSDDEDNGGNGAAAAAPTGDGDSEGDFDA